MPATAASLGLSARQFANLVNTVAAVKARKLPVKAAYIVVEAKLVESGMRVLASANVPVSQRYPHDLLSWTSDGLGHDHASCGDLQQQTGYAWTPAGFGRAMNQTTIDSPNGWGTPAELMNPAISTAKFLDALARHPWASMSNWAAAQAVQGSAFADGSNYRAQDARARQYVNAVWASVSPQPTPATRKRRSMFVYYVPNIPGGGANCFLFNGSEVRRVLGSSNYRAALAALGQAAGQPITYAQHLEWVKASPNGRVYA